MKTTDNTLKGGKIMAEIGVKIEKSDHQRNGVGGEPFYQFEITWNDDDGKPRIGIATLTVESDQKGEYPQKFNGSCRVVTPKEFNDRWRGDMFEREIRAQYKSWYED